ncbi:MAG: nicotinamide mononucleotide transporter [Bacteroidales bacterium]|nr:nicotinamide mononucleotide transporter [Bacteroidales bacterium]MBQ7819314.1 nicotinamide mononucleotide transporter [Bacteroidales bacterium]
MFEQFLEIAGVVTGLIYLWLEYKASIYLWIVSIIMPAIYLFIFYDAGLYADFGINIYYLVIALYGWLSWQYGFKLIGKKETVIKELPITRMPKINWFGVVIVYLILQLFISWLLIEYTNSTVPWIDSFTTALSIVAMWMLARKYVEQWLVWIVVDIVSAGLYIYKELYFTAGLYLLYAIIAIFGYYKWHKMMFCENN